MFIDTWGYWGKLICRWGGRVFDILGLDDLSESIYNRLLHNPGLDEDRLTREADRPAEAVCAAVGNLKRLGLVRQSWEDPDLLHAVGPEVGLGALLADQEAELAARHRELERARAGAAGFAEEYVRWRADQTGPGAELLVGLDATRNRVEELAGAARTEILAVHANPLPAKIARATLHMLFAALDRGVVVRSLYLESRIKNHPDTRAGAQAAVERGAQIRSAPLLPSQIMIFDGSVAVVSLDPDSLGAGVMMVRGAGVLTALTHLFEQTWAEAAPLGGAVPAPAAAMEDALGDTDRAVLRLLADGLTDETVARRLGVSLRTVRRLMARLMKQLDTNSRFAAGVRVAELRLL
jgi:DNA-binding CsgD family transcriptional regulator